MEKEVTTHRKVRYNGSEKKGELPLDQKKAYLLYTFLVLRKYSNEENPLSVRDIAERVHIDFKLEKPFDRRTVYSHLKLLEDITDATSGYDIFPYDLQQVHVQKIPHYYVNTTFTQPEVRILCDTVAFSRFIDRGYSEDLIYKLSGLIGADYVPKYRKLLEMKNAESKSYNQSLFYNIEVIIDAIEQKRPIRFNYLKYDIDKKLVPFRGEEEGRYMHPYYLIWTLNHYYLMCRYDDYDKLYFMRVDKMADVTIAEEGRLIPLPDDFNTERYTKSQAHMFGGDIEPISFRATLPIVGQVIDFFGEDVDIRAIEGDPKHCRITVETSQASIQSWLLQHIPSIDEITPASLHDKIVSYLEEALERNQTRSLHDL